METAKVQSPAREQAHPALARTPIRNLRERLSEEIGWLEHGVEDGRPTTLRPLGRAEAGYILSSGERRAWDSPGASGIHANEATPPLPNDDALPTASGSNEVLSVAHELRTILADVLWGVHAGVRKLDVELRRGR